MVLKALCFAVECITSSVEECIESVEAALPQDSVRADASGPRTALGITLRDTKIDSTVPGSPACMCGLFDHGDELLTVDGVEVDAASAGFALRGNDLVGSVVTLVLKKVCVPL